MKQTVELPHSVELMAHRGYAARFPENTREAIRAAVAAGAKLVEFDIQLTADKVPFLLHDEDFLRTGGLPGRIRELAAEQVARLTVGETERLGVAFAEVTTPSLQSVVEDFTAWPQVTAFVELKRQSIEHFGRDQVLDAVLPVLQPIAQQSVIISFDLEILHAVRERSSLPVGWALSAWDDASREQALQLQPEYLFCNEKRLPSGQAELWRGTWRWVIYEIVSADKALALARRGVHILETMAFAELSAALAAEASE